MRRFEIVLSYSRNDGLGSLHFVLVSVSLEAMSFSTIS